MGVPFWIQIGALLAFVVQGAAFCSVTEEDVGGTGFSAFLLGGTNDQVIGAISAEVSCGSQGLAGPFASCSGQPDFVCTGCIDCSSRRRSEHIDCTLIGGAGSNRCGGHHVAVGVSIQIAWQCDRVTEPIAC